MVSLANHTSFRSRSFRKNLSVSVLALLATAALPALSAPPDPLTPLTAARLTLDAKNVTCLLTDRQGNLWIGTEDHGLWRQDARGAWTQFDDKNGLGDRNCYALACDNEGRVWAGTLRHGVSVYNGSEWKNYGPLDGPLGSHVTALAVSSQTGDIWGATEAGLFRYSSQSKQWRTYSTSDGLPSNAISALAFDQRGNLLVATQADGIAIRSATEGFSSWRKINGPSAMPNTAAGSGLPSSLINCLCVARNGTIYAGTPTGLAISADDGATWKFLRGEDWKEKVKRLYHGPGPDDSNVPATLLREDYITTLAEDDRENLLIGHWRRGMEAIQESSGQRLYTYPEDRTDAKGKPLIENIRAILARPKGTVICGHYTDGAFQITPPGADISTVPAPSVLSPPLVASLPVPESAPTLSELNEMLQTVSAVLPDKDELRPKIIPLEDDWATAGDWLGRYGRYEACLCATQGGDNYHWSSGWELSDFGWRIGPNHNETLKADPETNRTGDELRYWVERDYTKDVRALELPIPYLDNRVKNKSTTWDVNRRLSSIDDHGEAYSVLMDGPHIYNNLRIPHGLFYLSLYCLNDNGHRPNDSCRDYRISAQFQPVNLSIEQMTPFPDGPEVAHARVANFYGGVWKRFLVRGPANLTIEITRNYSLNTILNAMTLDQVDEMPPPYFQTPEQWLTQTVETRARRKQQKVTPFTPATSEAEAANRLFESLEGLRLINSTFFATQGRPYYAALLRWYKAQESSDGKISERLARHIATCHYQLGQFPEWERYQNRAGLTTARQIEQALRWKDGATQADGYEMVNDYLAAASSRKAADLSPSIETAVPEKISNSSGNLFESALQQIAAKCHVTIVAEGSPLHPHTVEKDTLYPDNARAVIQKLADVCDYDVQTAGNIYVLRKRYTDPADLPDIAYGECVRSIEGIARITAAFKPKEDAWSILSSSFPDSLTPSQWQALQDRSLPISKLTPAQQEMIRQSLISGYMDHSSPVASIASDWLNQTGTDLFLRRDDLHFSKEMIDIAERHGSTFPHDAVSQVLGLEIIDHSTKRTQFAPLSGMFSRGGLFRGISVSWGTKSSQDTSDPTDPTAFPSLEQKTAGSTLASIITDLNARSKRSDASPEFAVDPALAKKKVTLAGIELADPGQVMNALKTVYGLRLITARSPGSRHVTTLTLPETSVPKDFKDLPQSLADSLPEPFFRALHLTEDRVIHGQTQDSPHFKPSRTPGEEETMGELKIEMARRNQEFHGAEIFDQRMKRLDVLDTIPRTLSRISTAQLRSLVEPELKPTENIRIPLNALPVPEKDALGRMVLSEVVEEYRFLFTLPFPDYLLQFDQVVLGGKLTPDGSKGQRFGVTCYLPAPDGTLQSGTSFFQIPYQPKPVKH